MRNPRQAAPRGRVPDRWSDRRHRGRACVTRALALAVLGAVAAASAPFAASRDWQSATVNSPLRVAPDTSGVDGNALPNPGVVVVRELEGVALGELVAVASDFGRRAYACDASPARVVRIDPERATAVEFPQPPGRPGFYPVDVAVSGFFIYVVDETDRAIIRFDTDGAYRDVLIDFDRADLGRRVSPYGIAVDASNRIAVTDVENHRVLVFDNFFVLQFSVGNYGAFHGQLDTPRGVAFEAEGRVLVVDTGNRRLQVFTDGGLVDRLIPEPGSANPLRRPLRAVVAADGTVYVADPGAGAVFEFDPAGRSRGPVDFGASSPRNPVDVDLIGGTRLIVGDGAGGALWILKVM